MCSVSVYIIVVIFIVADMNLDISVSSYNESVTYNPGQLRVGEADGFSALSQLCANEQLTFSFGQGGWGGEPYFVLFAIFHVVNSPTLADFKLST